VIKHKRLICLAEAFLCLLLFTGCWDLKELDDLSVPFVVAFDKVLEKEKKYPDDRYLTTVGVPVFYEDVSDNFHVIGTTGQLISEARGRSSAQMGEEFIYGQLQLLLIGEELAKEENLLSLTDVLTREARIKASILIIIAKGRAVDILKAPIHSAPNVGIYLKTLLRNCRKTTFSPYMTLFNFNRDMICYETASLLPHVIYSEGEIKLAGACLVNNGKLIGEMGREETETLVMLRGMKCQGVLAFKAEDVIDEAAFQAKNSRKVTMKRLDDKYAFDIKIKLEGDIVEHKELTPMQDGTDLVELFQKALEQHMKKRAEAMVEKVQKEYKCDALNLASYIKAHTREKLTKEDIDKIVREADINVEVEVQICNAGGKM
jgi:Ger(x)C family germination protein